VPGLEDLPSAGQRPGACSRARCPKVSGIGTNGSGAAASGRQSVGIMRFLDRPQGLPAAFVPNSDTPAGAWAHATHTHQAGNLHQAPLTRSTPPTNRKNQ